MEKIGFFGGCFNPPTIAHLEMAKLTIQKLKLDKIVFVPMNDFYNKPGLISSNHRYNMLKLLIKNESKLEIDDFEIKENQKMYAIDAFNYIDKNYDCEKYFIMGSDNYIKLKDWKDANKLKKFHYIILDRLNKVELNDKISVVSSNKFFNISSSDVRKMILEDRNVNEYLTKEVYDYIKHNNLYS